VEWKEFTAKTVDEALTNAMLDLVTTAENLEYEVIEKESAGFFGMFSKPAKIKVKLKMSIQNTAKSFLEKVFSAMNISTSIDIRLNEENSMLEIDIKGEEMGVLIGKRGQTLDSLQYLVSLVINKHSEDYVKVKLDTENYRARRKETLETLAKNISYKVKRTRKSVTLEPMNPYERRIIHSALQNDKFVETYSEGEEPYRKVVISVKKINRDTKPYKYVKEDNKNYSRDYKKDYREYKESKEKKELSDKE
jgi:spoIIIJ-associated protein